MPAVSRNDRVDAADEPATTTATGDWFVVAPYADTCDTALWRAKTMPPAHMCRSEGREVEARVVEANGDILEALLASAAASTAATMTSV